VGLLALSIPSCLIPLAIFKCRLMEKFKYVYGQAGWNDLEKGIFTGKWAMLAEVFEMRYISCPS